MVNDIHNEVDKITQPDLVQTDDESAIVFEQEVALSPVVAHVVEEQQPISTHIKALTSLNQDFSSTENLRDSSSRISKWAWNGASFVNGERQEWREAQEAISAYEQSIDAVLSSDTSAHDAEQLNTLFKAANEELSDYSIGSISKDSFTANSLFGLVDRMAGIPQAGGGAFEIVGGLGLILTPEPTLVTKIAGYAASIHGVDTMGAGLARMIHGGEKETLTDEIATKAASLFGADKDAANRWGDRADFVVGLGVPAGVLDDVIKNMNNGVKLWPAISQSLTQTYKTGWREIQFRAHYYMQQADVALQKLSVQFNKQFMEVLRQIDEILPQTNIGVLNSEWLDEAGQLKSDLFADMSRRFNEIQVENKIDRFIGHETVRADACNIFGNCSRISEKSVVALSRDIETGNYFVTHSPFGREIDHVNIRISGRTSINPDLQTDQNAYDFIARSLNERTGNLGTITTGNLHGIHFDPKLLEEGILPTHGHTMTFVKLPDGRINLIDFQRGGVVYDNPTDINALFPLKVDGYDEGISPVFLTVYD
jgi:hypothetical protein